MKKSIGLIVGIILCILVLGISYQWATGMMDSLYAYRSPLHRSPPVAGQALGRSNTRSLVIVLIDALRYDTSLKADVMPYLNELRSSGASALMHSLPPSYSQPGYTTILTGAWPDINDGPIITLYSDIPTFTQDDLFSAAHRAGQPTAISAFDWFHDLVPQSTITSSYYTAGEDQAADRQVTDAALPWLQDGSYRLVLIHLDQVDYAGHYEGGPIDPRWDAAATRVDGLLREIASSMDLGQDTLLVISDHGQIDRGGHGGQDPITLLEPFVMVGRGVLPGNYGDIQMVDIAPTVASILGINIPASNQGHVLRTMFDFSTQQLDRINSALTSQQAQLVQAYQTAIDQPVEVKASSDIVSSSQTAMADARDSLLSSQQIPRAIVAILVFLVLINMVMWHARHYLSWMFLGVISYLVIFNIKYLLIDHKTYSLSTVTSSANLIASTALTTFIALFVGWLLSFLGTQSYQFRPFKSADATMKFILVTLTVLLIPVLINYIINGAVVAWTLPNFLINFLGFISLIQMLVIAALGIILTGISALIGVFAR